MTKQPLIRFKGFHDDWEQRKISDIANSFDNFRVPIAANLRTPGPTPYYGANGIQDYVEGYTHNGEFVLVAEDGANDIKNYPVKCVKGYIWVNNHAHVLQGNHKMIDNRFLAHSISQSDIKSLLVGCGRAKLNAKIMMGIILKIPTKQEQVIIGEYINQLDNLITLHQRKLELLTQLKKAYLQKLFPRTGQKLPEIRFANFQGDWEQRKLESVITETAFKTNITNQYPILSSTSNGICLQSNYFSKQTASKNNIGYKIVPRGHFTYRSMSDTGIFKFNLQNIVDKGIVSPAYPVFSLLSNANSYFIEHYLNYSAKVQDQILLLKEGGTRYALSYSKFKNLFINLPDIDEQSTIGSFFKTIDILITLHQQKLNAVGSMKKSWLSKLFV